MNFSKKNKILFKILKWEFWPWQIFYIPVIIYYLWLSLKSKSLFFFFSTNPGIESGGMLIESKKNILDGIPKVLIPKTIFFRHPVSLKEVLEKMYECSIFFPVIVKPDYGERGWKVEKIEDKIELDKYLKLNRLNILVQEFIDYPVELGIFYIRHPDENTGMITSIVRKKLLSVLGDGKKSVKELIMNDTRAFIYFEDIKKRRPDILNFVPGKHENVELVPIANHCRGATFIDGTEIINPMLTNVIDTLAKKINGFYYGRFDIRCKNINDLNQGLNFKILELNGAKSEPAHIYQPGFYLLDAYKILFNHWKQMYMIARSNAEKGIPYPSFNEGWKAWKKYRYFKKGRK